MLREDSGREVTIREADAKDVLLIASLATASFYEAYFEQDDPHDLANYLNVNFSPETIRAELADPHHYFFLIFRRGRAVGYAKLRDDEPHASIESKNSIELQRIYLIERVWGTGLGERLLNHCLRFARTMGKDTLWLGVWEENKRGLAFYAKHGFERVGTLEFSYADSVGINAVMRKLLK